MKNYLIIFFVFMLVSCTTIKTSNIFREIERPPSNWEVVGFVRIEILIKYNTADYSIPYDQLLNQAREKYGNLIDIIEIKKEEQILSYSERDKIFNESKILYKNKVVYNALVIKYSPLK